MASTIGQVALRSRKKKKKKKKKKKGGGTQPTGAPAVAAGVADQPVEVRQDGIKGCISYGSLHKLALWRYQETVVAPLRRVRWMPPPISPPLLGYVLPKTRVKRSPR